MYKIIYSRKLKLLFTMSYGTKIHYMYIKQRLYIGKFQGHFFQQPETTLSHLFTLNRWFR